MYLKMSGPAMGTIGGYDRLALLFSRHSELANFRCFRHATLKCLLYKQAELTYLETQANASAVLNRAAGGDEKLTTSYQYFAYDAQGAEADDQREAMKELEEKLGSYRKRLSSRGERC
jgi:hypothetical protein